MLWYCANATLFSAICTANQAVIVTHRTKKTQIRTALDGLLEPTLDED